MRGTTPRRMQGMADPVLASMVRAMSLEKAPHYKSRPPNQAKSCCDPWAKNAIVRPKRRIKKEKDGSVGMIELIRSPFLELGW